MEIWINRDEALEILGVKAQSLYAYVSRGQIEMLPDPDDSRRSLYRRSDIDNLIVRRGRGRKRAQIAAGAVHWGEPAIPTTISTVKRERLIYRGMDAVELSRTATLEEVAALLWKMDEPVDFIMEEQAGELQSPFVALGHLADRVLPMTGRGRSGLCADGRVAVSCLLRSLGGGIGVGPVHEQLAENWSLDARGGDLIRRVLVLMADHELNPSTFAVRVAASTGASVAACLMAGLATLSGPRHGLASNRLLDLSRQVAKDGAEAVIARTLAEGRRMPGFGHPLYPNGDPRAAAIMEDLPVDPVMAELAESGRRIIGEEPDVDFALAMLIRSQDLPTDAGFHMFAIARSIGWVAHAMEQSESGQLIRPRAYYAEF